MKESVYKIAIKDKRIASLILLPLIEFEFSFFGSKKPILMQGKKNYIQLMAIYEICKSHGWNSGKVIEFDRGYVFGLNNNGFKEIYSIAGPMADPEKDKWANLLLERANRKHERTIKKKEIMLLLKTDPGKVWKTKEICINLRRLPYSITRQLRKLEKEGYIRKEKGGWRTNTIHSANSPS